MKEKRQEMFMKVLLDKISRAMGQDRLRRLGHDRDQRLLSGHPPRRRARSSAHVVTIRATLAASGDDLYLTGQDVACCDING
eukprot:CAMPEP_0172554632 /NCGR_PEP_ID=MMETSP1067-20121228/55546_1 /TAXON_ID=265564 ORGANISM="Thalassiosira punctigera, Strain Tpunct2005C2" /NCGR_SAMPLE_ID=MMETSP1067 /ASSEMBLY_ACC=CAM_ASM_000444 /LENGTH=81 /DNA_ID=CAMNT_0013343041 /DNA_START=177 /DNA_END=420 /DNA_ORIENTATION=+